MARPDSHASLAPIKRAAHWRGWSACAAAMLLAGCSPAAPTGWSGYAEGDYVYVASPVAGRLRALSVRAGDAVVQGAPLFTLDDDPERHTRLSWRQAITHQVSQSCASYFDQHQADWQPERGQGLYAFWRESLIHDHGIGLLMGLPHLGQQLKALPATWQDAEQWVLQRLGLPPQVWADYLEAVLLTVNGWASWCAYLHWQAQQEGKTDSSLRELIAERTIAGLASARARGRKGGRPFKMTAAKLRLAMAAMGQPETKVGDLCRELGITRQTLYRHISPKGDLRPDGAKLLSRT